MKLKRIILFALCLLLAFFNYKFAKYSQLVILNAFPNISYVLSISVPWILLGLLSVLLLGTDGLKINKNEIILNRRKIILSSLLIILGLILFVFLGITKYFHSVKYPIIFFVFTPIAEELIFRGFIYSTVEKISKYSPVIISAVLFGLHHLQYFNFSITKFALFQVAYTFILGLLLGRIRKLSGSIYLGVLLHIIINIVSVMY